MLLLALGCGPAGPSVRVALPEVAAASHRKLADYNGTSASGVDCEGLTPSPNVIEADEGGVSLPGEAPAPWPPDGLALDPAFSQKLATRAAAITRARADCPESRFSLGILVAADPGLSDRHLVQVMYEANKAGFDLPSLLVVGQAVAPEPVTGAGSMATIRVRRDDRVASEGAGFVPLADDAVTAWARKHGDEHVKLSPEGGTVQHLASTWSAVAAAGNPVVLAVGEDVVQVPSTASSTRTPLGDDVWVLVQVPPAFEQLARKTSGESGSLSAALRTLLGDLQPTGGLGMRNDRLSPSSGLGPYVGPLGHGSATPGPGVGYAAAEKGPIIAGSLDRAAIDRVVEQDMPGIRACYESRLARNSALSGRISVRAVIATEGGVSSTEVKSSTVADPEVGRCVARRFKDLVFPTVKQGITIVLYPLVFTPAP